MPDAEFDTMSLIPVAISLHIDLSRSFTPEEEGPADIGESLRSNKKKTEGKGIKKIQLMQ